MSKLRLSKVGWIDTTAAFIIALAIGLKHGVPAGLFCFSVMHTLDQIYWLMAGRYVVIEGEVKK